MAVFLDRAILKAAGQKPSHSAEWLKDKVLFSG